MGDTTAIEWATATWNPWWGCRKVSPGCANCYAETLANRFHDGLWRGQHRLVKDWGGPGRVDRKAAREGRRARLFVASMADVFEDHPDLVKWRGSALHLLAGLKHTDVLLLTKRPENVARMVPPWWTVEQYGYIDGEHHKDWLLDQIAQIALGTEVVVKLATWKDDAGTVVNREYRVALVDPPSEKYLMWRQADSYLQAFASGEDPHAVTAQGEE